MVWGFFRTKTQQRPSTSNEPVGNGKPVTKATSSTIPGRSPITGRVIATRSRRTMIAPEPTLTILVTNKHTPGQLNFANTRTPTNRPTSAIIPSSSKPPVVKPRPLSTPGTTAIKPPIKPPIKRYSSTHSIRTIRSVKSSRSLVSVNASAKSMRSGSVSARTKHIKAAHAAKRAAIAFFAKNRDHKLKCYTCGSDLFSIRCDTCRTTYVPPEFRYNAASAALFANNYAFSAKNNLENLYGRLMATPTSAPPVGGLSGPAPSNRSITTCSISGAESLIGFLPENEKEFELATKTLDLELIEDLAKCDEAGLLEEIIFEGFSNVGAVVNSFYKKPSSANSDTTQNETGILESLIDLDDDQDETGKNKPEVPSKNPDASVSEVSLENSNVDQSTIDFAAVKKMYNLLSSMSSTTPMRGILQGAQAVLQVRQHHPLTEQEMVYICVVLQCPAITECSMFTKITGPMQKLSRYVGLRTRARIVLEVCAGLIAHCDEAMHDLFVHLFSGVEAEVFSKIVDLANAFISHRLSFDFHVKTNTARPTKYQLVKHEWYCDDWRIITMVKLLTLLYAANNLHSENISSSTVSSFTRVSPVNDSSILPEYAFYNTMIDFVDLKADYDAWQLTRAYKKPKFCFCRYPFMLSVGAKAKVFEYSIQREVSALIQRECFARMAELPPGATMPPPPSLYLDLRVRRQHLLDDSMKLFKNWTNSSRQRMLKIEFVGEPGIDAGGLTKEWIYLFYQRLFDPSLNVFQVDESSNYFWFGKNTNLNYYRIAGMVLGFALYNGIAVDINLPPLLFKLLLNRDYSLDDVSILWPDVCRSLQQILDYQDDDFEDVFGLTFSSPDGKPLLFNGDSKNVNLENREAYVKLLVEYMIDAEGEPFREFKKGFDDVCSGNTLLLFQPEELELLVRGDKKPIDIPALRSVTKYVNFGHRYAKANKEPIVQWFWDFFSSLDPTMQARLLRFVTSTDRAPAAGMVHMKFAIRCLGGDSERLPIAHTCFNELCLYKYKTRAKLEAKLSLAIAEHEGFGLK